MFKALAGSLLATFLGWGALAAAEPEVTVAAPGAAGSVRKDPRGSKGISPFREAIVRGDSAFMVRDFDGAIAAYRDALGKEPQNALGHYRIGEAQVAKDDLHEAEQAFVNGLRYVAASDSVLKAKLQFALADLRERQKAWDEANAAWTAAEAFSNEQTVGFPASCAERKRAVEAWKKLSADSAQVKARIQKGIAAADEAVRKSSK